MNADEVPGYREVIAHPMDLGTMERKLHEQQYTTMDMFRHDFLLVTQNAQTFNPPTSIYHTAARRLEVWGVRAIEREGLSVVDDDALASDDLPAVPPPSARRARRKVAERPLRDMSVGVGTDGEEGTPSSSIYVQESGPRRTMRIGSARSTNWSNTLPEGVPDTPETNLFRRTLAYAGVSPHTLTGKSACSARMNEKAKSRLGPLPSFLAEQSGTANPSEGEEAAVQTYTYADDGSLDPAQLANLYEYAAQVMGPATLLAPAIESLRHLPMSLAATPGPNNAQGEASFVFPHTQPGRPDRLSAATVEKPVVGEENWSHTFQGTSVPDHDRRLPFAIAGASGPPGLAHGTAPPREMQGLHPVWPVPPPPPIQDPLQSGLRLNRRERELEQERDEHNWTFFRPHLLRLLDACDVGVYSSLPAWVASTADERSLRPYSSVAGGALTDALREYLRAMPYRALGLPRTAQYVPRASLRQLPAALQISMQGAQESERLLEVAYGGVQGAAFVRSIAEFINGAAAGIEPVARGEPAVKREEAPVKKEEEADAPWPPPSASAFPVPEPDTLPTSLVEHVKDQVVNPLTGGLTHFMECIGEHLAQIHVGPTPPSPNDEPLYQLLDDANGAVSSSLWRMLHPHTTEPQSSLQDMLDGLLHA